MSKLELGISKQSRLLGNEYKGKLEHCFLLVHCLTFDNDLQARLVTVAESSQAQSVLHAVQARQI